MARFVMGASMMLALALGLFAVGPRSASAQDLTNCGNIIAQADGQAIYDYEAINVNTTMMLVFTLGLYAVVQRSASAQDLMSCGAIATQADAQAVYDYDTNDPNGLNGPPGPNNDTRGIQAFHAKPVSASQPAATGR